MVGDDYSVLTRYINKNEKILFSHLICGTKWYTQPNSFLQGSRCPKCSLLGRTKKSNKTFLSQLLDIVGKEYCSLDDYTLSNKKIRFLHNVDECGNIFEMTPNSFLSGQRCPKCSSSKGERMIYNFLSDNQISFYSEFTFSDCKNKKVLPFDFYLADYNILIEYDGILHYKDKFDNPKEFNRTKTNDKIKTKYCKDNNIYLLRIPYWDFNNIDQILTETLFS